MSSTPTPLLIIVHPGSACGSADMNLGRELAQTLRLDMQEAIEQWRGAVAVIDGELSEELKAGGRREWMDLGRAIEGALAQARDQGLVSARVMGDDVSDYPQSLAVADLVRKHGWTPDSTAITLTGAWVEADGGGCVNDVREVLEGLGFTPTIDAAMDLDAEDDTQDDDFDGEPDTGAPSESPSAPAVRAPGMKR